jgi:hypothetical protein
MESGTLMALSQPINFSLSPSASMAATNAGRTSVSTPNAPVKVTAKTRTICTISLCRAYHSGGLKSLCCLRIQEVTFFVVCDLRDSGGSLIVLVYAAGASSDP